MPRIAVAILVVAAIVASIVINTARFPAVRRMMDASHSPVAPRNADAALVPGEPRVSPSEPIDLGAVAPPSIEERRLDGRDPIATPVSSSSTSAVENDGWREGGSAEAGGSMHFVTGPRSDESGGPTSGQEAQGAVPTDDSRSMESLLSGSTAWSSNGGTSLGATTASATPAAPIVFGLGPGHRGDSRSTGTVRAPGPGPFRGPAASKGLGGTGGSSAIGFNASSTWPAEMSPILKFTRKPALPEPATSDSHDVIDERPLVPVAWPDEKKPAGKASEATKSTAGPPLVERLPPVEPTAAIRAKPPGPPAESPIPIYPSTGK